MKKERMVSMGVGAKTARAIVVVLGGTTEAPLVLTKLEIPLADPKIPATAQPYHEVMDLPWEESQKAVRKSAAAIETIARKALTRLLKELHSQGMKVSSSGVVGAQNRRLYRSGYY